ncbi:PqqD family peptide modification chaperone [Clostridiales bacterium]|nr:PqqD family peptide modification chaperone [Clostridiales bacterium]
MYYYRIAEVTLQSAYQLKCFEAFACEPAEADIFLEGTDELPAQGKELRSGAVVHRKLPEGWYFFPPNYEQSGLFISNDYSHLRIRKIPKDEIVAGMAEWFVRIAVECMLARRGYVSLHSASVEVDGIAYAFTAPSGTGKSTRAEAWIDALGAKLISGDRPLIDVRNMELYGVPWDGKEQCFRNVHYPLKAICEVRRAGSVYIREMSYAQRRKVLMQQCFIPMWDTETAALQIANINKLAMKANMVRIFCGPTTEDAQALYSDLQKHEYLKEEKDMKANPGFILRNVVDEYILMPTGDNIGKFNGTVLLNEVSALVWEKLQNPISREDLLKAILDEFEVEKAVAAADLDALLAKLKEYGVISED